LKYFSTFSKKSKVFIFRRIPELYFETLLRHACTAHITNGHSPGRWWAVLSSFRTKTQDEHWFAIQQAELISIRLLVLCLLTLIVLNIAKIFSYFSRRTLYWTFGWKQHVKNCTFTTKLQWKGCVLTKIYTKIYNLSLNRNESGKCSQHTRILMKPFTWNNGKPAARILLTNTSSKYYLWKALTFQQHGIVHFTCIVWSKSI
jgi:hypothetical protein